MQLRYWICMDAYKFQGSVVKRENHMFRIASKKELDSYLTVLTLPSGWAEAASRSPAPGEGESCLSSLPPECLTRKNYISNRTARSSTNKTVGTYGTILVNRHRYFILSQRCRVVGSEPASYCGIGKTKKIWILIRLRRLFQEIVKSYKIDFKRQKTVGGKCILHASVRYRYRTYLSTY